MANDIKSTSSHVHPVTQQATTDSKAYTLTSLASNEISSDPIPKSSHGNPTRKKGRLMAPGSWVSIWASVIFHVPALTLSALLIWANSKRRFWFDVGTDVKVTASWALSSSTVLHLLQLAAKGYGLFLVMSLSAVILSIYRTALGSVGLPLGLIAAGYRTGDIGYLRHPGLWGAMSSHQKYIAFGSLAVGGTLLAALSEPACAILAVPIPGWYPLRTSGSSGSGLVMYPISSTRTWPPMVNISITHQSDGPDFCLTSYGALSASCPGIGFYELLAWAGTTAALGDPDDFDYLSVKLAGSPRPLRRRVSIDKPSKNSATFLTTPSAIPSRMAASYFAYVAHHGLGSASHTTARFKIQTREGGFQPLLQAKCQAFDLDLAQAADKDSDTDRVPYFPMEGVDCLDDSRCASWQSRPDRERLVEHRHWYDLPRGSNLTFSWLETGGPLSAVFNIPFLRNMAPHNATRFGAETTPQACYIVVCSFVSRWIPSEITAQLPQTDTLESNVSDSTSLLSQENLVRSPVGYLVQVAKSWADLLNFNLSISNTTYEDSQGINISSCRERCWNHTPSYGSMAVLLQRLIGCTCTADFLGYHLSWTDSQGRLTARVAERVVGAALADGLSQVGICRNWIIESPCAPIVVLELTPERIVYAEADIPVGPMATKIINYTIVANQGNSTHPTQVIYDFGRRDSLVGPLNLSISMAEVFAQFQQYQRFGLDIAQYGYGSGTPSPTLTFATVVICVYMAAVTVYAATSLARCLCRPGRRSRPPKATAATLADVQDLIVLAWKSAYPQKAEPAGVGGAEPSSQGWRQVVTVRDDPEGLRLIAKNKSRRKKDGSGL